MNRHSQKGSALLIVLGFLSFMVVSAVAFAIWMRNERLPSSALRRNVANRYLVKAALAQAMSRVDDAIRSHPYPGAWSTNNTDFGTENVNVRRDKNGLAYDWWESRVFMPPDPEGVKQEDASNVDYPRYAPVTKTVSVLNLEALGYLPPEIVNDVRLLSRSSWAAQWEYFNFDAGRYAFCAVNVSDLLDINKLAANSPRTSAAPARPKSVGDNPPPSRFSLAYLFRSSEDMTRASGSDLKEFDEFVHKKRYTRDDGRNEVASITDWKEVPFVSLMDYNLGMGAVRPVAGLFYSPFSCFVSGETRSGGFYGGVSDDIKKRVERQPFVTDSWFPRSEYEVAQLKLDAATPSFHDIAQYQPFLPGVKTTVDDVDVGLKQEFWRQMRDEGHAFCAQDTYMLYDYLDEDNVPLSLAMPCAERVPMVTALGPLLGLQVEFSLSQDPPVPDGLKKTYDIKIKVTPPQLSSGVVFPFMKGSGDDSRNYDVQAFMRLVFVDEASNASAQPSAIKTLRSKGLENLRPENETAWKADDGNHFKLAGDACLLVNNFGTGSFTPDVEEPKDAYHARGMMKLGNPAPIEATVLQKIEYYKPKSDTEPNEPGELDRTCYQIVLPPLSIGEEEKLVVEKDVAGKEMEEPDFDAFRAAHNIRPYLMTWVRVKDGGKTVDLVPAAFRDDNDLNGINNLNGRGRNLDEFGFSAERDDNILPILFFPSTMTFTYPNPKTLPPPTTMDWKYKACYTVDPRYNWAPENWWFEDTASPTLQTWYTRVFGTPDNLGILDDLAKDEFPRVANTENRRGDRARDPILFVSNLGYLQSVGELAFLPRLSEMDDTTPPTCALNGSLYNGGIRDRDVDSDCAKTMPCARVAWKSYQNYRTNADPDAFEFGANLYRRGLLNPQQGFYVNPFTQSKEVMLAAFANTPLNYWVAGTNYQAQSKSTTPQSSFDRNYVFDSDSQLRAGHLAEYMMHRYEDLANMLKINDGPMTRERSFMIQRVWADMFDALDWGGRLEPGKIVEQVYEELNVYYSKVAGALGYKDMYSQPNGYSALNHFMTRSSPGVTLDLTRATHLNELADPLYYYSGYPLVESVSEKEKDLRNPDSNKYICDADRMFLHSYWRDCFANRQQLFLIFVRAESTALGGNGEGTPAQQGGRAVALVWRDPGAPTGDNVYEFEGTQDWNNNDSMRHPHKMRILFYRQLD